MLAIRREKALKPFKYDLENPEPGDDFTNKRQDIEELYEAVKLSHDRNGTDLDIGDSVQHPLLRPQLRPYQVAAVKWMLTKEQIKAGTDYCMGLLFIIM